jgi:integrase
VGERRDAHNPDEYRRRARASHRDVRRWRERARVHITRGYPLAYANFCRRVWVPAVSAAELALFTPHGVRHTAVALAIATGAHPKQIQELCRHRSITTTLNEYGGLFESLHEGLADRLEATIQVTRAGLMRDEGGTNIIELRGADAKELSTSGFAWWGGQDSNPRHEG